MSEYINNDNDTNENIVNENSKETDIVPVNQDKEISYGKVKYTNSNGAKSFLLGVCGGIVGAVAVFAVALNTPMVKDRFMSSDNEEDKPTVPSTVITNMVEYQNPVPNVASIAGSSVVGISVEYSYNSFFGVQRVSQEGSGIIISTDGYIITNNHVVSTNVNSEIEVMVYLPNRSEPLKATIVGTDAQTDIAVLKVDCTDLPAVTLGSSDDLEVGSMVVAIGNPLGRQLEGSVTVGYVSALNRKVSDSQGNTYILIQTDAAINEGNSGGALVNTNGELVGINMAKIEGTGIEGLGFAIPIDDVKDIIDDLIEFKKVIRPTIGIQGVNVDEATKNRYNLDSIGVYIKYIESFSAAEIAGLRIADIITEINGVKVTSMEELNAEKNKHKVGDKIELTIIRGGKEMKVDLTLKEQ